MQPNLNSAKMQRGHALYFVKLVLSLFHPIVLVKVLFKITVPTFRHCSSDIENYWPTSKNTLGLTDSP